MKNVLLVILILSIWVLVFTIIYYGRVPMDSSIDISGMMLGAASIVLTGVGIIIAIAAIWGYNTILDQVKSAASVKIDSVLDEKLSQAQMSSFISQTTNNGSSTDIENAYAKSYKKMQEK